jgi:histidine triad (HIT) family protein
MMERVHMRSLVSAVLLLAVLPSFAASLSEVEIKALYAKPSPFESVPREQWIAESKHAFAIRDKNPQAPIHMVVISKTRVPTMLEASPALLGEMLALARKVAIQEGVAKEGFRIVINTLPAGGQGVYHLHIHVLGGREMLWPPG